MEQGREEEKTKLGRSEGNTAERRVENSGEEDKRFQLGEWNTREDNGTLYG